MNSSRGSLISGVILTITALAIMTFTAGGYEFGVFGAALAAFIAAVVRFRTETRARRARSL